MRLLPVLLLLLSSGPLWAAELQLEGQFTQGGLLEGRTEPAAEVIYREKPIRLSPDGRFVIGFGRDAPPQAALTIRYSDGREEVRQIDVAPRSYQTQRIDGLPPSKVTPPEEVWARIQREAAEIARVRAIDSAEPNFTGGFLWPVLGRVSGVYGSQRILNGEPRRPHFGIDIAAPAGTSVIAPAAGVVTLAESDLYFTGGTIILDHGHGLSSAFLHLQNLTVGPGDRVKQGDIIGTVGSTGRSTGPHLDWRVNWFEERLDPALLAGPMPEQD